MVTFKDKHGKERTITLNAGKALEVDRQGIPEKLTEGHEVSLLDPPKVFFDTLINKTSFCLYLVWVLLDEEIEEVEFASDLDGPSIRSAKEALYSELENFFQDPRISLYLSQTKRQTETLKEVLTPGETEELDRLTKQGLKRELAKLKKRLSDDFGSD